MSTTALTLTHPDRGPAVVQLRIEDATVFRAYGRAGHLGEAEALVHARPSAARNTLRRLAFRLIRNGYQVGHHHPGLIAAIAEAPDDPEGYLVYADWLGARGDPRAELIHATLQERSGRSIQRLLRAHPFHFVHPRWRWARTRWWMGFVREVSKTVGQSTEGIGEGLQPITCPWIARQLWDIRRHPSGRFLRAYDGVSWDSTRRWRTRYGPRQGVQRTIRGALVFDADAPPWRVCVDATVQPFNLNDATLGELVCVPGIGDGLAQRILDVRAQRGGFAGVEDLRSVQGIGPRLLARLHTWLRATPDSVS